MPRRSAIKKKSLNSQYLIKIFVFFKILQSLFRQGIRMCVRHRECDIIVNLSVEIAFKSINQALRCQFVAMAADELFGWVTMETTQAQPTTVRLDALYIRDVALHLLTSATDSVFWWKNKNRWGNFLKCWNLSISLNFNYITLA